MTTPKAKAPIAFKIALFNLALGTIGILATLLFPSIATDLEELSLGLLLLGLGEYINNPQYDAAPEKNFFCRRRNVSSLGNLLDIAGLLMLSIGLTTLFF